jgi:tRNA pseudouridine13 synthase
MIPDHWRRAALEPAFAWGSGPLAAGVLRASPEDFKVDEVLGFAADGEGPHALLQVRKRGANTEWVARELARAVGCKPFDVGFAGMKDRNAVTTQHFTVPRGKRTAEELASLRGEGYEVVSAVAHRRKLPRGALEGNRFEIVVRDFHADPAAVASRAALIATQGVPNYFGPQRFGREASNLASILSVDANEYRGRSRKGGDGGFVLSAARSLVFNAILSERVSAGTWNRLLAGDVANLDGRGSTFGVDVPDEELARRCEQGELHPTAPLPGDGESKAAGDVLALEQSVMERFPEVTALVQGARVAMDRRALRLLPRELVCQVEGSTLRLRFTLPKGAFATTLLRELVRAEAVD